MLTGRRDFLKQTALASAALSMPTLISSCSEGNPPNVLWLISEDTSPDMGCYGNPLVKTPNFDRLAGEGVRFENAFATCPVCSPARSAMMTGVRPTST